MNPQARATSHSDFGEAFDGFQEDEPPIELSSTGLPFLDRLLCGGTAPGEVYGFMGPIGSCKTTMAIQLMVEAARACAAESVEGGEKKVAVLVSYEASYAEVQVQVESYAAKIPRERLEKNRHQRLSNTATRNPYELQDAHATHYYGRPGFSVGERERIEQVRPWLNQHIKVIDMTRPRLGSGGVMEVAGAVKDYLDVQGCTCGFLAIDYVGAMAKKMLTQQRDISNYHRVIGPSISNLVIQARQQLALGFDCPVWLIHQLSGEVNGLSPAAELTHRDAADCRSFADGLDFCFNVGTPRRDHTAKLRCTKHRRQPSRASTIIKINGSWSRVDEACGISVIAGNRQLVTRREVGMLGDTSLGM